MCDLKWSGALIETCRLRNTPFWSQIEDPRCLGALTHSQTNKQIESHLITKILHANTVPWHYNFRLLGCQTAEGHVA
jgi:hypothetical protein